MKDQIYLERKRSKELKLLLSNFMLEKMLILVLKTLIKILPKIEHLLIDLWPIYINDQLY